MTDTPTGWVYVIGIEGGGAAKIGYTKNPPQRFKALRANSGKTLLVVYLVRGNPSDERALHRRFADLRLSGEWFSVAGNNALGAFLEDEQAKDFEMALLCDDFNEDGDWGALEGTEEDAA